MRSERGYTLIELLVVLGLAAIMSGVAIPVFVESTNRNRVWTAAELIGANVRQARLKAISSNTSYRVRFDCPATGVFRVLRVTGDPVVDDAGDRCTTLEDGDSGEIPMPPRVSFGAVPTLEVNGRGLFTAIGGVIPQTITVTSGGITRTLRVTAAGQVSFRTLEEEVADEEE